MTYLLFGWVLVCLENVGFHVPSACAGLCRHLFIKCFLIIIMLPSLWLWNTEHSRKSALLNEPNAIYWQVLELGLFGCYVDFNCTVYVLNMNLMCMYLNITIRHKMSQLPSLQHQGLFPRWIAQDLHTVVMQTKCGMLFVAGYLPCPGPPRPAATPLRNIPTHPRMGLRTVTHKGRATGRACSNPFDANR